MEPKALRSIALVRTPSVTDRIFVALYDDVVTLALPPGSKLSEADVARRFGVSRQPVRDAFYRLSQLGFVVVRPQRATTVSQISESAVLQARFIRTAIEIETARAAAERLTPTDLDELDELLAAQANAVAVRDRIVFHGLDDDFHRRICEMAGLDFAWSLIRGTKAQMDRVRFLSLAVGAESALIEHRAIFAALRARDAEATVARVREHLSRIEGILSRLRASHQQFFAME
ncbi:MAG: GntR family transcriptional regulator [Rhodobacteraceae bacterium]|nr:GntR family transcriptional regulator [Paracoccaceae bacterium]